MLTFKISWTEIAKKRGYLLALTALTTLPAHASFIETTVGTAVVNDATASYYNPAALVLTKNAQIITQGTAAYFHTQFKGQSTTVSTGLTENGNSSSNTHYYSPSLYLSTPITDKILVGLAIITNSADRNADENSILRYVQASNNIQDRDIVPAIAIKINQALSIGGGINFSYADFHLHPILGFPGSNIADSESTNQSDGTGVGANAGFLIKPAPLTVIGFNYRTLTTYRLSGYSTYNGTQHVESDRYHFKLWTPARSVLSVNHFVTDKLGFITTIQRIQWSALTNVHVYGIAGLSGTTPVIRNGTIPYYLRDTWLLTLGTHYKIAPHWMLRVAGSYGQSPGNPHYQIANGDSIVIGASTGYEVNKLITIDASYAHAFMKNENINIKGNRFLIRGVNEGSRDGISVKLTLNV